jgi:hypothetical protein
MRTGITAFFVVLLGLSGAASMQPVIPATPCDDAVANSELHFPSDLKLEDGTKAFSYLSDLPFVQASGELFTINVALRFEPGPQATIKLSALDEECSGNSSSGTVFTYTFGELPSPRNTLTFNRSTEEVGLNGTMQKAVLLGAPRYLFIDVWDGLLPSTHATHSYVIDLQDPKNPSAPQ